MPTFVPSNIAGCIANFFAVSLAVAGFNGLIGALLMVFAVGGDSTTRSAARFS